MLDRAVLEYLESHRGEHLTRLLELLRIPSIANNDDDNCRRAGRWIADTLGELGFDARLVATGGKPNVLASLHVSDQAPTLLIYGHYDVQPPEPLELWQSPPFSPEVRDGWLYARGADDDKGQLFAHIMAIEAWQRAGGGLPVNVKLLIEGEEEIGSPRLEAFVTEHRADLSADAAVISDSAFFAEAVASITYALRGLAYVELTLRGPDRDLHSGLYGGAVANPINALGRMIGLMHDAGGKVAIAGFYDDVAPLEREELAEWQKLPFDAAHFAGDVGLDALAGGETSLPPLVRLWARPTLDCNGIIGGYTGPGSKTVIPAQGSTKISMRLVPGQSPEKIVRNFKAFVADKTPAGLTSEVKVLATAAPVILDRDSAAIRAASEAYEEGFGEKPAMIRCGASVPVTELVQRILGLDAVLMGFGLPSDRLHSPNERFALEQLYRGSVTAATFYQLLRAAG